jgi:hypothetical protein
MRVDEHRLDPLMALCKCLDAGFRFAALDRRRRRSSRPVVKQNIGVVRFEHGLGDLALPVFLPLVVAEDADHRRRAQPDQS